MKSNRMAIVCRLIFIEILLISTNIISARNLPVINYPGTLPGTTPIALATSLIGTPQWVDFRPDGKEIYFQTWVGENLLAKVTKYTGEQWTTPVVTSLRVSPLSTNGPWSSRKNTGLKGNVNCVSPDGKYYFFMWGGIKWVDIKLIEKFRPITSGFNQINESRIEFYPNPAIDLLNITLDETKCRELNIELYNIHGNLLFANIFQNTTTANIDLTDYPKGVYLIKVTDNGKIFNGRIIKG